MKTFKCIDYFDGISVCINLNTICNLKCPYCFNKDLKRQIRVFHDTTLVNIIDNIAKYRGYVRFMILGGEPLLYPKLQQVIEYMLGKDNCEGVELYTNGTIKIPFVYDKVKVIFSLHPTELKRTHKDVVFVDNVNQYPGNCEVQVQMYQTKKAINSINEIIGKISKPLVPNFIHNNEVTEPIIFQHPLNDVPVFLVDEMPISYKNAPRCFKSFTCNLCGFSISNNGDVSQACLGVIGNILKDPDIFKYVAIPHVCEQNECKSSCFMGSLKYAEK